MPFRKILCATDFSPGARSAVLAAAQLARRDGAELELFHAWSIPVTLGLEGYVFPPIVVDQMVDAGTRGLADAAAMIRDVGPTRVTTKLVEGGAWESIMSEVERDQTIDLVVVGTHGRTGLPRMLLGSVAERVVRNAPCSVLVVRPTYEVVSFDHIACPIDFEEPSREAVALAAQLAQPGGRGLTLMHVLELPVAFEREHTPPDFFAELDHRATRKLEEWTAETRARTDVPVASQLRVGGAAAQTISMLDADPTYDLVVVGSHGRTGLRRLVLGSVAERVVRHAKSPVLVARRRS